jgi:hypothetical protein
VTSSDPGMEQRVRDLAYACMGKAAASRHATALDIVSRSLEPGERIEGLALCGWGNTRAGIAAVTDRRILFVSRTNAVSNVSLRRVSAVHREWCATPQRRVRVAVKGAKPLHMVSKLGADVAAVIRRNMAALP